MFDAEHLATGASQTLARRRDMTDLLPIKVMPSLNTTMVCASGKGLLLSLQKHSIAHKHHPLHLADRAAANTLAPPQYPPPHLPPSLPLQPSQPILQQMSDEPDFRALARVFLMTPDLSGTRDSNESAATGSGETDRPVRCICQRPRATDEMIQCCSCRNWLHRGCVPVIGADQFICPFCQGRLAVAVKKFFQRRMCDVLDLVGYKITMDRGGEWAGRATRIIDDTRKVMALVPKFAPTAAPPPVRAEPAEPSSESSTE